MNRARSKDPETAFIGKITAALSHELMNVLATIREASGLMEDLLVLEKKDFPHRARCMRCLATVREQVRRGIDIDERMNRFAHSMDEPRARVEIPDFLEQMAFLLERFARLSQIRLEIVPANPAQEMETDPFRLQMILAACIESCLGRTEKGGVIRLECGETERGVFIRCLSSPSTGPLEPRAIMNGDPFLYEALRTLEAELLAFSRDDGTGLELLFSSRSRP